MNYIKEFEWLDNGGFIWSESKYYYCTECDEVTESGDPEYKCWWCGNEELEEI